MQRLRILVVSIAVLVAMPALLGGFVWDDKQLVAANPAIGAPLSRVALQPFINQYAGDAPAYYRPIPKLALSLTYRAAELEPWAFHLVNVILHGLCVWLAFGWIARRIGATDADSSRLAPAVAIGALVFAWHPSRPQAVTWISGCTELWPALFLLTAAWLWERRGRHIGWSIATACACAFAYLSKESAIVFPVLLVLDAYAREPLGATKRHVLRALPCFLGAIGIAHAVRVAVIDTPWSSIFDRGVVALAMRMLFSLGHATSATFWPWNPRFQLNFSLSSIEHLEPGTRAMLFLGAGVFCFFLVLSVLALRKPELRPWWSDVSWFLLPLLPALNLVPIGVGTTIGERFLYVPMLGCAALLARAAVVVQRKRPAWLMPLLCAPLLFAFARTSLAETRYMLDERSLFEHFYEQDQTELWTIDQLVNLRLREGDVEAAHTLSCARVALIVDADRGPLSDDDVARNRARALMTFARLSVLLTSDIDRAQLVELRSFYDSVFDPTAAQARLRVCERDFVLKLSPAARAAARESVPGAEPIIERLLTHGRTLDLAGADAVSLEYLRTHPHLRDSHEMRVRTLMWQERWSDARAALDTGRLAVPAADWKRTEAQLEHASRAADASEPGSTHAVLSRARAFAELGMPAVGYAILDALPQATQRELSAVQVRVTLLIADRRFDLAERALEQARQAHPGHTQQWLADLQSVRSMRARSPLQRVSLARSSSPSTPSSSP